MKINPKIAAAVASILGAPTPVIVFAADVSSAGTGNELQEVTVTAQRREEVAGMTWDEVDLERATWSIASNRTKNKRAHDVPLSAQAVEILQSVDRRDGRARVFGSRKGPFSGWSKAKAALDRAVADARAKAAAAGGVPAAIVPWSIHDLRRTVATGLQRLGVRLEVT